MKFCYRDRQELYVTHTMVTKIEAAEFLSQHRYDNIYFENDLEKFVGCLNYEAYLSQEAEPGFRTSFPPLTNQREMEDFFFDNPGTYRCPVIRNGRLEGEIALEGYFGKDIQCKYNEFAKDWFFYFIDEVEDFFKSIDVNKVCVLLDVRYQDEFSKQLSGLNIEFVFANSISQIGRDVEFIINLKFPDKIWRVLFDSEIPCESLYEITEAIVLKITLAYLGENRIDYLYFEGPNKKYYQEFLDEENKALKYQSCISLLLKDKEYIAKIADHIVDCQSVPIFNGRHFVLSDYNSDNYNVQAGERKTVGQPGQFHNKIHMYGPCIVQGFLVRDDETIASYLQNILSEEYASYCVVNHGINGMGSLLNSCLWILSTPLKQGDIVIEINTAFQRANNLLKNMGVYHELSYLFDGMHYWFFNHTFHCNYLANNLIANEIRKNLHLNCKLENSDSERCYFSERNISEEPFYVANGIQRYLQINKKYRFESSSTKKCGAIVMSADPFTLGHLYLVQTALKYVDYLYVFVVQEETGTFAFVDRFEMVKRALSSFTNISVLSTGEYIHSVYTFPEYNMRGLEIDKKVDASKEIRLFATFVAPFFDIRMRFFGEEPADYITASLNESAKDILPQYGITPIIIPRKKVEEEYVSGTIVRKHIFNQEWKELTKLVPSSTLEYLQGLRKKEEDSLIKLSIIITSYNSEACVEKLINIAKSQENEEIEIIIVDGGSSDNTRLLIDQVTCEDKMIFVKFLPTGTGKMVAKREALNIAKSKYVMFLSDEDKIAPNSIKRLCDFIDEKRIDIALLSNRMDSVEDDQYENQNYLNIKYKLYTGYEVCSRYLFSFDKEIGEKFDFCIDGKIIRKSILEPYVSDFGFKYSELLIMGKIYRKASRIAMMEISGCFHQVRGGQVTYDQDDVMEIMHYIDELSSFYNEPFIIEAMRNKIMTLIK